ncbi:MAG: hypothetical protein ACLGHF_07940 [Alphaproteobacteria bacterium]|jgi:DNA-binding response OmpR family regulator
MTKTKMRTALVVEESPLIAMNVEQTLLRCGFAAVHVACSPDAATDMAGTAELDFALLSVEPGGVHGSVLAPLLARRSVPFAFICDLSDGSDVPPAWRGTPYLAKPYTEAELAQLIAAVGS